MLPGCVSSLTEHWGFHRQRDGRLAWSSVLRLGCTSATCLGTCDKARAGMCIDGAMFRFNCAHFGQKQAGVPLFRIMEAFARLCITRVALRGLPAIRATVRARRLGGRLVPPGALSDGEPHALPGSRDVPPGCAVGHMLAFLYVDDLLSAQNIYSHGPCQGAAGGCPVCSRWLAHFAENHRDLEERAAELGLPLNHKKRQAPSQRVTYTGITIDTVVGRMFILQIGRAHV